MTNWTGARRHETDAADINAHAFLIRQILATIPGSAIVQVKAVTRHGEDAEVGFVDVLPLVNQIDGNGVPTKHDTVHNLPYFRLQGGTDAVIMDPYVGDIGLAIFAHRDISIVKKTKAQANPGSRRQNDWSDGLYLGGFLNGKPVQYVQFVQPAGTGINIVTPGIVNIRAKIINLN